jgi:predicted alpha/beta-hydrolase family hydrolase
MAGAASGLAARGIDVLTFDFPYMHAKRGAPDKAPVLEHCFRAVVEAAPTMSRVTRSRLFIGGKSMGGRMATHLAAEGLDGLEGVVVFGYPLHPPGQPHKLRFGSPAELAPHVKTMSARVDVHAIAGADHSLSVKGKRGPEVFDSMLDVVAGWIG